MFQSQGEFSPRESGLYLKLFTFPFPSVVHIEALLRSVLPPIFILGTNRREVVSSFQRHNWRLPVGAIETSLLDIGAGIYDLPSFPLLAVFTKAVYLSCQTKLYLCTSLRASIVYLVCVWGCSGLTQFARNIEVLFHIGFIRCECIYCRIQTRWRISVNLLVARIIM
jgi:hypothetical protein